MQNGNGVKVQRVPSDQPVIAAEILKILNGNVSASAPELVRLFYDMFLCDPDAAPFLSHKTVEMRLSLSLKEWLLDLFRNVENIERFAARQRQIGEVHARIKIPFRLVMKGAALLKREVSALLVNGGHDTKVLASALISLDARVDWAIGLMSEAYMQGSVRRAQIDEAFRLFAVGQDMSLERETQHAALMDWLQSILFPLLDGRADAELTRLSSAPFGLWFHHRAGLMFPQVPGLEAIESNMRLIDQVILPQIEDAKRRKTSDLTNALARLRTLVEELKFVLGDLFQSAAGVEGGRDPLTRVLNRRFLPTILGREISIAEQTGAFFTVLMVDVDHFKQINDR
jgi:diguanylate cyclase